MKSITRFTPVLLLLFVFASTASWAGTVIVGSLDLVNTIPGPGGVDTLLLTNITASGVTDTPAESLTFSNVELTVNGVNQTANLVTDVPGVLYELDNLAQGSITSIDLSGSLGTVPLTVTVNGQSVLITPAFYATYSGAALDTSSISPHFDVTVAPEPSSLSLFGLGVFGAVSLWFFGRRRVRA